jgi:hypothetical protein
MRDPDASDHANLHRTHTSRQSDEPQAPPGSEEPPKPDRGSLPSEGDTLPYPWFSGAEEARLPAGSRTRESSFAVAVARGMSKR